MAESSFELSRIIGEKVQQRGGRAYYVGGFVRDRLLGLDSLDVDIEVHDIRPEVLREILGEIGNVETYGASFGIYTLAGSGIDIAMPRRERLEDLGETSHRNFEVEVDPGIGTVGASRRRDFTVNALMEDILTGEIIDHWGGMDDLKAGVLRHVDSRSFPEDPLRVLRGAQFGARFGFKVAEETLELCRGIDLGNLSRERVEGEMKKALMKAERPSVFFEILRSMNQLSVWFPELEPLAGLEQDPVFHPEGDVWTHTMEVLDRAAGFRDRAEMPYGFMLLALTHDMGKAVTTEFVNGRWHAYRHEIMGVPIAETFMGRLVGDRKTVSYVLNMIPHHMKPNVAAGAGSSVKSTNRMFDAAASGRDLIWFAECDKPVMAGSEPFSGNRQWLEERYSLYEEIMSRPYVMGRDLIDAGLEPGEDFHEALEYAHKLRLAGIGKDEALTQVLGYMRNRKRHK